MNNLPTGAAKDVAIRSKRVRDAGIELKQHPDEITFA